jgi:hypothetical protein
MYITDISIESNLSRTIEKLSNSIKFILKTFDFKYYPTSNSINDRVLGKMSDLLIFS